MLNKQIGDLKTKMEPLQNAIDFTRLSGELKNKMIKWDREIQDKKKKKSKYNRDSGDYTKGEVFKWQSKLPAQDTGTENSIPMQTQSRSTPHTPIPQPRPPNLQGAVPKKYPYPHNRGRGQSNRGNSYKVNQVPYSMPYNQTYRDNSRGPPRQSRGRHTSNSSNRGQYSYNHPNQHSGHSQYERAPVLTQNRFSPLRYDNYQQDEGFLGNPQSQWPIPWEGTPGGSNGGGKRREREGEEPEENYKRKKSH